MEKYKENWGIYLFFGIAERLTLRAGFDKMDIR